MHRRLALILIFFASSPGTQAAPPDWPALQQQAQQFARERVDDGRRLVLGPTRPAVVPVPAGQSCAELYLRRVQLMQTQVDYRPPYLDDPRNRAAVFIGTIFTPAFYYLGFTGVQAYLDATSGAATQSEIDALRFASAMQQCYIR